MKLAYTVIERAKDLPAVANAVLDAKVTGLDIETYKPGGGGALDPRKGFIRLIQLKIVQKIYVVDCLRVGNIDLLIDALRRTKSIFIIHNAKFEQKWFWHHYRLELWPIFDTYRSSALLYNGKDVKPFTKRGKTAHDLDSVVERELGEKPTNTGQGGSDWAGTLTEVQLDYAAEDVLRLDRLRDALKSKLERMSLLQAALIEFGVVLPEGVVELNGFPVSTDQWSALADLNRGKVRELTDSLLSELPHPDGALSLPGMVAPWKLTSPDQVLRSLRRLGVEIEATDRITLTMAAAKYPVINQLLMHRKFSKRLSSFGPAWLKHLDAQTHRIHSEYFAMLAAGRYSSSKPNLQQIPRESEYRACFRAPEGKRLVAADYAGIEMRIVAEISQDGRLIRIFQNNEDAHFATASLIMAKSVDQITKAERQMAKPVNFGFIYGMGAKKLVLYAYGNYGVAMTEAQAMEFRRRYFDEDGGYSGVATWHRRVRDERERMLEISRTMSGRLRFLNPREHYNEYFNCLDAKTEALTLRGWVPGMDLKPSDVLLTKNASTGLLEWQQPTEVKHWPEYEGPLVEFRSRSFNAVSTPNHRWLVRDKHSGKDVCKTTAEISRYGDHRIHRTGHYPGVEKEQYSDTFVEFVGWLVTDGSLHPLKTRNNRIRMTLAQSQRANPDNVRRIDHVVNGLGWGHSRHVTPGTEQVQWVFQKAESARLSELFPRRRLTVRFLQALTRPQLLLLREVMLLGDGTEDAAGQRSFVGRDAEVAGLFQLLCTLCGEAASVLKRDMSHRTPRQYSSMPNVPKAGVHYVVNIQRRQHVQVLKEHDLGERISKEPIWCPIVPNTYFVARREGQVFVTGNTPVQGTGADALKLSLRHMHDTIEKKGYGDSVKMVHHVHDEILLETDDDEELVRDVKKDLEEAMHKGMEPFLKQVPIKVDASDGYSWAEAK